MFSHLPDPLAYFAYIHISHISSISHILITLILSYSTNVFTPSDFACHAQDINATPATINDIFSVSFIHTH